MYTNTYTNTYNYTVAEQVGDRVKYIFNLAPYGDIFYNFRLQLNRGDPLPIVEMLTASTLDKYDMNKWPFSVRYVDDLAIYDLDFWFSRKDTPMYSISVPYGLRRIEVFMPRAAPHIRLIRTDGFIIYQNFRLKFTAGIRQDGFQHVEEVYNEQFPVVRIKSRCEKIRFHCDFEYLDNIQIVVLAESGNNIQTLTYDDLRRYNFVVAKNICELDFGDFEKLQLTFSFTKVTELTMLSYKKINATTYDGRLLIRPAGETPAPPQIPAGETPSHSMHDLTSPIPAGETPAPPPIPAGETPATH